MTIDLDEFKSNPARALELARSENLIITECGAPKFQLALLDEDAILEEELLQNKTFIAAIEQAKEELKNGEGVPLEDVKW